MTPPFDATTYCTDEDVAAEATGDVSRLTPRGQVFASGVGGSTSGWTLSDPAASFASQGVVPGCLLVLSGVAGTPSGKSFGLGGETFVVATVASETSLTFRPVGMDAGVGQPPATLSAVVYALPSFGIVRKQSSDRIRRLLNFDLEADLIDSDDLRQLCVYHVLMNRYRASMRSKEDEFAYQTQKYATLYDKLVAELAARRRAEFATDDISVIPIDH